MDSGNSDTENTPPEIIETATNACLNLLPQKSRQKYEICYKRFMEWRQKHKVNSFSENVAVAYFEELSKTLKSPTLWSHYSMLRSTINVDLSKYLKLRAFLKRRSDGYTAKKSKTLTSQEINVFIKEAPDNKFLLTKVNNNTRYFNFKSNF